MRLGVGRPPSKSLASIAAARNMSSPRTLKLPLYAALAYLAGTYLLFLTVGQVNLVRDILGLTIFVALTLVFFAGGYLLRIRSCGPQLESTKEAQPPFGWIRISAIYYAVYGLTLLYIYGATGPAQVFTAIMNPGTAYLAKFEVFAQQSATGVRNPIVQILTLVAVLYTPLIPFSLLFWSRLSVRLRIFSLLAAGTYGSFFLFVGTLKGLGDLLVFFFASYLIRTVWSGRSKGRAERRRLIAVGTAIALAFVTYMAYNQSQRIQEVGIEGRFQPNSLVASIVGKDLASGLAVVAFYPTHGYVGLAYNLDTGFRWSSGLGASRALDSYWVQYVGGRGASETAYPYRTEVRTGWPAGMYWATIYPWLASDLSFPGTILFMGVLGWFYARFWYEAAFQKSLLSVLLFCQLTLLLFYVPANNQIGLARTSLIAFVCLSVAYCVNRITRPLTKR